MEKKIEIIVTKIRFSYKGLNGQMLEIIVDGNLNEQKASAEATRYLKQHQEELGIEIKENAKGCAWIESVKLYKRIYTVTLPSSFDSEEEIERKTRTK